MLSRTMWAWIGLVVLVRLLCRSASAEPLIVRDGTPNAEIVTAAEPNRMQKLAAEELQTCIRKISGAELPIVSTSSGQMPVRIYVGQSEAVRALGLTADGLKNGAYRMVSGESWLALLGDDTDFVPPEPYALNGGTQQRARVMQEWDALTGGTWNNPVGLSLYRRYSKEMQIWEHDRHASMNADASPRR